MHPTLRSYDCLIFDWDGTLVDSASQIIHAVQQTAQTMDLPLPGVEQIRSGIGLGLDEQLKHLFPDPPDAALFHEQFRAHFFTKPALPRFFEGALELLERCHLGGWDLAIATGMSRRSLNDTLDRLELGHLFAVTCTADESASKPNPMMLERILEHQGLDVGRAIMVGDTTFDIQAAKAIGMDCVAVLTGVHDRATLEAVSPTWLCDSVKTLQEWL